MFAEVYAARARLPPLQNKLSGPAEACYFGNFGNLVGDRVINDAWRAVDLPPVSKALREKGAGGRTERASSLPPLPRPRWSRMELIRRASSLSLAALQCL